MFTYMIEKGNSNGYIWVFEGDQREVDNSLLFFINDVELKTALKGNRKGAVIVLEKNSKLLKEGERLSKFLGLEFQHP